MPDQIRARWKGGNPENGYLPGIPARDLDEDEWRDLSNEERASARRSPLYTVKTNAQMDGGGPPEDDDEAPGEPAPDEGGD